MGLTLRPYQELAVGHLQHNPRAGLFLDMGLGKTATVLTALTPERLPALVVAPKRVAENVWEEEVRIWRPDLSIAVAAGSPAQRQRAFNARADITVIGRDNLADALPHPAVQRNRRMDASARPMTGGRRLAREMVGR